eukprot:CAMPEP_0169174034 /NCGR_PEP_ID=MMETSP1015-20121227/64267_1 /TAXON_ID=342587 /ORGANISM="Karlodinium micrum, Strain CCMP2283" /LENGTH=56 /DNA_ID=CAMNT_0009247739 /DNA_START=315 /DNA_END=482 /DNA_ORIENTATION=+
MSKPQQQILFWPGQNRWRRDVKFFDEYCNLESIDAGGTSAECDCVGATLFPNSSGS